MKELMLFAICVVLVVGLAGIERQLIGIRVALEASQPTR